MSVHLNLYHGSFQFFPFLLFEEMNIVCSFLIGELYLFTIGRWRTLSSLQLFRVIFNSRSSYTTMSFRVSGYHFDMSTSNGFFFFFLRRVKTHLTSLCSMYMGTPTASMWIMPMVCRGRIRILHKLDMPVT